MFPQSRLRKQKQQSRTKKPAGLVLKSLGHLGFGSIPLKTGELAADAITSALDAGDTSAARLGAWEPMVRDGYGRMRELVCAFYEGFSFAKFLKRHPHYSDHVVSMLIGDIFRDDLDEMFDSMQTMRAEMMAPAADE